MHFRSDFLIVKSFSADYADKKCRLRGSNPRKIAFRAIRAEVFTGEDPGTRPVCFNFGIEDESRPLSQIPL
jgi:hypothetical protein